MTARRSLAALLCTVACVADEYRDAALEKAEESVRAAVDKASKDPSRPIYHFRPPAQWMNDPNGTIFHNGYYHVFYQHNPFADTWGHMHWGHARSKDLVHWEHLPIALWPSEDKGEAHVFSGCAAINGDGVPMLFYTSVAGGENKRPNQQWAAIGDEDLIKWEKHPKNPILDVKSLPFEIGPDWRDPFIFKTDNRTFMVVGADTKDEAIIPIFEADTPQLDKWTYRGILYRQPKDNVQFFECPNFFPLDGKWVLIYSPYKPLQYLIGSFDANACAFAPENGGTLDFGSFYASNVFQGTGTQPTVLVGWIRGFTEGLGWNGCMSVPRRLSIGEDGYLRQIPVAMPPDLDAEPFANNQFISNGGSSSFRTELSCTSSGKFHMSLVSGGSVVATLTPKTGATPPIRMEIGAHKVKVDDIEATWNGGRFPQDVEVVCLVDRSVLEVAIGPWNKPKNGTVHISKVVDVSPDGYVLLIEGTNGASASGAHFRSVPSIWID